MPHAPHCILPVNLGATYVLLTHSPPQHISAKSKAARQAAEVQAVKDKKERPQKEVRVWVVRLHLVLALTFPSLT